MYRGFISSSVQLFSYLMSFIISNLLSDLFNQLSIVLLRIGIPLPFVKEFADFSFDDDI